MLDRTPTDGRPYYCHECGSGFGEYLACDLPDCRLESEADALKRQLPVHVRKCRRCRMERGNWIPCRKHQLRPA